MPETVTPSLLARAAMALHAGGLASEENLALYRELAQLVRDEGPECVLCGQRGLNWGNFAQPLASGGHAHWGCEADRASGEENNLLEGPM